MKRNAIGRTMLTLCLLVGVLALVSCAGGEQTITGTVEKTDQGHVLVASDGTNKYKLVENQDFSSMVGKSVKLTGTLMDRVSGKAISVTSFEVVEEGAAETGEQKPAASD